MGKLLAPMVGKVIDIKVKEGDTINVDDVVMVVESMKMETPIYATESGTVKELKVNVGDSINEEDVIAIIE
ncbi:MAG: acetyl-CoA carboxylase biotin carboxyl carrier protein subunit [Thermoanaerobacteraceae bacterium]|nr:acetyl-CoA carboxylase biotin carboxyl carrier protein subunit [Thermoanaerobacteraceae bacterium]